MEHALNFSNKTVFVAGGTGGVNLGIAKGFSSFGAKLAVVSRSESKVDNAVSQLRAYGEEVIGFTADVRDYEQIAEVLEKTHKQLGEIDIIVSGAAGNFPAKALDISSTGFKSVLETDLLGTFHVLRAAHPFLKKPGGSIINISAPQSFVAMKHQAHVCAAKAGVDMLTKSLAKEWGVDGIRINSIVPGPIEGTEGMSRIAPNKEAEALIADTVPLKRLGSVDDIANAALLLCSPFAEYITGAVLPVDGGWSLGGAVESMSVMSSLLESARGV